MHARIHPAKAEIKAMSEWVEFYAGISIYFSNITAKYEPHTLYSNSDLLQVK